MFYNPQQTQVFKEMLVTIVGQPLDAAGYIMEDDILQQARGMIHFQKRLLDQEADVYGFIEWQLLAFEQSPAARFQVILLRNHGTDARAITSYVHRAEYSLPWVIWHVFDARILPSDDVWWDFRDENELAHALSHAGRLLFGYGVPWLELQNTDFR